MYVEKFINWTLNNQYINISSANMNQFVKYNSG